MCLNLWSHFCASPLHRWSCDCWDQTMSEVIPTDYLLTSFQEKQRLQTFYSTWTSPGCNVSCSNIVGQQNSDCKPETRSFPVTNHPYVSLKTILFLQRRSGVKLHLELLTDSLSAVHCDFSGHHSHLAVPNQHPTEEQGSPHSTSCSLTVPIGQSVASISSLINQRHKLWFWL